MTQYIESYFEGCELVGRIEASIGAKGESMDIYLFSFAHVKEARQVGRPVGALYGDGACMVWPREWYKNAVAKNKVIACSRGEARYLATMRKKMRQRNHDARQRLQAKQVATPPRKPTRQRVERVTKNPRRVIKRVRVLKK